jgi:DeoR family suf operon transcriptional repressor
MKNNGWVRRLLAGTRGRLLTELRRGPATINDLVERLAVSANAVRSHLAALERDGLIAQSYAERQGVGKPAHIYSLAPEASSLSPKAYDVMLGLVLDTARDRNGPKGYAAILKDLATRIAGDADVRGLSFDKRLENAMAMLAGVGAQVQVERSAKKVRLVGTDCPLSSVVGAHPELCSVLADAIARRLGTNVTECCDRTGALPHCCFEAAISRVA